MNEHTALTKPPQRPHHWMNADGTCHAGDLFEAGTPAMPLYTFEQMEAWVTAERNAAITGGTDCPRCGGRRDEAGLSGCDSPIRHANRGQR